MNEPIWTFDGDGTETASRFFNNHPTVVHRNNRQILITGTPVGRLELIPVGSYVLAAAETLPEGIRTSSDGLSPSVIAHCQKHHLQPWKVLPYDGRLDRVLSQLWKNAGDGTDEQEHLWSPILRFLDRQPIIGESRGALCSQIEAILQARRGAAPMPLLLGPSGIGRRTLLAEVASHLGLTGVELPLGRLLSGRVLQTAPEALIEFLLDAQPSLNEVLLTVSGGEWICSLLSPFDRKLVLDELVTLPFVALLTEHQIQPAFADRCVVFRCPGLGIAQSEELLAVECPRFHAPQAVLEMMSRAASLPGIGVVPSRMVFLARLTESILPGSPTGGHHELHPDDVAPVVAMAVDIWKRQPETNEELPGRFWNEV